MKLRSTIIPIADLTSDQKLAMFLLLCRCFSNVDPEAFEQDLADKDVVILLHSAETGLCGFSSQLYYKHRFCDETFRVVYSGDTVISREAWGSPALPIAWSCWMQRIWEDDPKTPLLWLLISKGIRTYRFLPTFFNSFYPRFDEPTPPIVQRAMHDLAAERFGSRYDPERGIVRAGHGSYYLSYEYSIVPPERLSNPHIAFFCRRNPGYVRGAELLCLTQFEPSNLTDWVRKAVAQRLARREAGLAA